MRSRLAGPAGARDAEPRRRRRGGGAQPGRGAGAGHWIAFLDDDDEWLPDKLTRQLAAAAGRAVSRHLPLPGAHAGRRGGLAAHASTTAPCRWTSTCSTAAPRSGGTRMSARPPSCCRPRCSPDPVQHGPPERGHDAAAARDQAGGGGVVMSRNRWWYCTRRRPVIRSAAGSTGGRCWAGWTAWAALVTRRAYSGFCLIYLGSQAARRRDWRAFPVLLPARSTAVRHAPMHVLPFLAFWIVPPRVRQRCGCV